MSNSINENDFQIDFSNKIGHYIGMYLISAYFDEESNRVLQGYIDEIAKVTGNDFMTKNHVPPHFTLSAIEARDAEVLVPAFEALDAEFKSGQIEFVTIGQLMPQVIYAAPYLNGYLMDLSQVIYDRFKDIPETTVSKYYKPLSWLPHSTLGKMLAPDQMLAAVKVTSDFKPFTAKVVKIGLAKVNPHEDVRIIKREE